MEKYVLKALDTLAELCDKAHDGEDKTFQENSDRLRAAEAILQHAREKNIQLTVNGYVPVRPIERRGGEIHG